MPKIVLNNLFAFWFVTEFKKNMIYKIYIRNYFEYFVDFIVCDKILPESSN